MKKIYVGNLSWGTTDRDLETLFSAHGDVRSATVITDRDTGRSRGFGFVEMEDQAANEAISALNDKEVDGRRLKVESDGATNHTRIAAEGLLPYAVANHRYRRRAEAMVVGTKRASQERRRSEQLENGSDTRRT